MTYNEEKQFERQSSSAYAYDDGPLYAQNAGSSGSAADFEKMLYETSTTDSRPSYSASQEDWKNQSSYGYDYAQKADFSDARGEQATDDYGYKKEYASEESTPSRTTMQFVEEENLSRNPLEDYRGDFELEDDRKYRINTKGKVLIAVYAIVVAAIFALIILNTRLLKSMNTTISSEKSELESLKEITVQLSEELSVVSSDEEIERKALEMGMIKSE